MNKKQNTDNQTKNNNVKESSSIWDDDMVEKYLDGEGNKLWRCLWCKRSYHSWSATKALLHVAKVGHQDIRPCDFRNIDEKHSDFYKKLLGMLSNKRKTKQNANECISESITTHNTTVASSLEQGRKKQQTSGSSSITSYFTDSSDRASEGRSSRGSMAGTQLKIPEAGNKQHPSSESQLTMAIADLIHSRGLPFSLASDRKFRKVLVLSKNVLSNYKPPSRNSVAGELLDLNYKTYMEKNMELLKQDAEYYGVCFFGDGATVKKKALLNILASGVHLPSACLEIVDCAGHMETGGKKDAKFIANCFLPFIERFEVEKPNTVDLALFDGASNVQKAGEILAAIFPRISVVHGAEHVVSLFFNDVFRRCELQTFIKISRILYKIFGSGSMHGPYAIFQKYSKHHNGGMAIGMIRAADTRMGGHVISLMRLLRLQDALRNTVTSVEFINMAKVSFCLFVFFGFDILTNKVASCLLCFLLVIR